MPARRTLCTQPQSNMCFLHYTHNRAPFCREFRGQTKKYTYETQPRTCFRFHRRANATIRMHVSIYGVIVLVAFREFWVYMECLNYTTRGVWAKGFYMWHFVVVLVVSTIYILRKGFERCRRNDGLVIFFGGTELCVENKNWRVVAQICLINYRTTCLE